VSLASVVTAGQSLISFFLSPIFAHSSEHLVVLIVTVLDLAAVHAPPIPSQALQT